VPRSILPIKAFEGGLNNKKNPTDIEDNQASDMVNTMTDKVGVVRLMGSETEHALSANQEVGIVGQINPGYGLFSFPSDYSMAGLKRDEGGRNHLAVQSRNTIGIYDGLSMNENEIDLSHAEGSVGYNVSEGTLGGSDDNILPGFYFDTFSGLRACDTNFSNDNHYAKVYRTFGKTWFVDAVNNTTGIPVPGEYDEDGAVTWAGVNSYIFPPSINATGSNTHQLYSSDNLDDALNSDSNFNGADGLGCIGLKVTIGAADSGDFVGDTALKFGISFQYDDGQESTISSFFHTIDTSAVVDHSLGFQLFANLGTASVNVKDPTEGAFDPRIKGINLYETGVSDGNHEDPRFLAFWDWGSSDTDLSSFTSHENISKTVMTLSDTNVYRTESLVVKTVPALTYRLKNETLEAFPESTAARYKTSTVSGQLAYIGGVQRYRFLTNTLSADTFKNCSKQCSLEPLDANFDRVLISQAGKMDIFTPDNFIDVASNDGESVTALKYYKDRLLLYKQKTLYILNMSGEFVFPEHESKYMGVNSSSKVAETDFGVAWINENGCFIYTGEGAPLSLSEGKLEEVAKNQSDGFFSGINEFGGLNGAIGYIPSVKQLIIFKDSSASGDVLIYDFITKSWSFGANKVSSNNKSNIISNYDDSCMYLTGNLAAEEKFYTNNGQAETVNNASWIIENLGSPVQANNTKIKIGDEFIVGTSDFGVNWDLNTVNVNSNVRFIDIVNGHINGVYENGNALSSEIVGNHLKITRGSFDIIDSDPYSGNDLTFVNTPSTYTNVLSIGLQTETFNSIEYTTPPSTVFTNEGLTISSSGPLLNFIFAHIGYKVKNAAALNALFTTQPSEYSDLINIEISSANRSFVKLAAGSNWPGTSTTDFIFNPMLSTGDSLYEPSTNIETEWSLDSNQYIKSVVSIYDNYAQFTGAANGNGIGGNPQSGTEISLTDSYFESNATLTFPGIVFKNYGNKLIISIWGKHDHKFIAGNRYSIAGTLSNAEDGTDNDVAATPGLRVASSTFYGYPEGLDSPTPLGYTVIECDETNSLYVQIGNTANGSYQHQDGIAQTFTSDTTDTLTAISWYNVHHMQTETLTVKVFFGEGFGGTLIDSQTVTQNVNSGWNTVTFETPQALSAAKFTVQITCESGDTFSPWTSLGTLYTLGRQIDVLTGEFLPDNDIMLRVYTHGSNALSNLKTMASAVEVADNFVTFQELDDTIAIDNSQKTGASGIRQETLIHVDKGIDPTAGYYNWSINDYYNGLTSRSYFFEALETPNQIIETVKEHILELITDGSGVEINQINRWHDTSLVSVVSGGSSGDFKVVAIGSLGTSFKINKNLKSLGIMPGDGFSLSGTGVTAGDYKLASLSDHNFNLDGTPLAGFTEGRIVSIAQPTMGYLGVIQNSGNITSNTNLSSITMNFSIIKVVHKSSDLLLDSSNDLQVLASSQDSIVIKEFNNISTSYLKADNFKYETKHYDGGNAGLRKKFLGVNISLSNDFANDSVNVFIILDESERIKLETIAEFPTPELYGNNVNYQLVAPNRASIPFRTIAIEVNGAGGNYGYKNVIIDNISLQFRSLNR